MRIKMNLRTQRRTRFEDLWCLQRAVHEDLLGCHGSLLENLHHCLITHKGKCVGGMDA